MNEETITFDNHDDVIRAMRSHAQGLLETVKSAEESGLYPHGLPSTIMSMKNIMIGYLHQTPEPESVEQEPEPV